MKVSGQLRKMTHSAEHPINYFLSLDEKPTAITPFVGKKVGLHSHLRRHSARPGAWFVDTSR